MLLLSLDAATRFEVVKSANWRVRTVTLQEVDLAHCAAGDEGDTARLRPCPGRGGIAQSIVLVGQREPGALCAPKEDLRGFDKEDNAVSFGRGTQFWGGIAA